MRYLLMALVACLLPGGSGAALAQRFIVIPQIDSGDRAIFICELPPDVRPAVRERLGSDPYVAFVYRHWYVFEHGFDFWTWDGRFALYADGKCWDLSRETLDQLLGADAAAKLATPWRYRIPPGLATTLVFVGIVTVSVYRSNQSRARRVLKDGTVREAFEAYVRNLPEDDPDPDSEARQTALAAAVEFLKNSGVDEAKAERSLRLLIGERDRDHSYSFRNQAVAHEEAGEWDLAVENYEKAARLREEWDQKDHAFLLKCIERVRKKRGRSGSE